MTRGYKKFLVLFYAVDVLIIIFSFCVAYILRFGLEISKFSHIYQIYLLIIVSSWMMLSFLFRIYRDEQSTSYRYNILQYLKCQLAFFLILISIIVASKSYEISRIFNTYFFLLEISLTLIFHIVRHRLLIIYRKMGYNYRHVALIGKNDELTSRIKNWILQNQYTGLRVEELLFDIDIEQKNTKDLKNLLINRDIEYVIVLLSPEVEKQFDKIVYAADNAGIRIKLMSPIFEKIANRLKCELLAGIPIINLYDEPLEHLHNRIMKRILDITVSSISIILVHFWLTAIVGALIRLTSKGPFVFCQKRMGKDGKDFIIYKFRTMTCHKSKEEEIAGIGNITEKGDSRLTPIGKWLRATNIDEFLQFFNVFIGNMSLVGPRPHMMSEDKELEDRLERYRMRRFTKPGITGWAQINGYRGGTKDMELMQKRIDYDIWYIENWSIWLDIKIIAITLWQTLTGRTNGY